MDNRSLAGSRSMLIVILLAALAWPAEAQERPGATPAAEEPVAPLEAAPIEEPLPPGTPTVSLARAVSTALERNFGVLNSADAVASSRLRESVSRAQFYPQLTPSYRRSVDGSALGVDAQQKLPWTGGTVSASAQLRSNIDPVGATPAPLPRTSDFRLVLTQPVLRGFGPNAAFFD